jgi:serine/threonine-protein kinase
MDLRPEPFIQTEADEFHPAVSPDGRWMAYTSDVSGRWEVYITPFPEPGSRIQVSTEGGAEPDWSPDGHTLYYRSLGVRQLSREMFAVSVTSGLPGEAAGLKLGAPELLFDGPFFQCSEWGRSYDLSPEGDRFLMVQDERPELTATQINVVVNWFSELPTN